MTYARPAKILAALLVATLPALALAAAPLTPQAAITARQAGYKKMGAAMKQLNEQLKTDAPNKDIMAAAARTIATTAVDQPKLFPTGSGPSAGIKTDALPAIWTDRATFDGMMTKMLAETAKLSTVAATGDAAAIRLQFKATGGTCGACHRQFRAEN